MKATFLLHFSSPVPTDSSTSIAYIICLQSYFLIYDIVDSLLWKFRTYLSFTYFFFPVFDSYIITFLLLAIIITLKIILN